MSKNQNLLEMKNITGKLLRHTENETCSDLALYCTHDSGNVWGWNVRAMT